MVADPLEAKRLGISDQLTEDPVTAWQGADARSGRLVDADEQESLELLLFRIEDAQRRIARSGEIACHLEHLPQDGFEVELRNQSAPDLQQAAELVAVQVLYRPAFQPGPPSKW